MIGGKFQSKMLKICLSPGREIKVWSGMITEELRQKTKRGSQQLNWQFPSILTEKHPEIDGYCYKKGKSAAVKKMMCTQIPKQNLENLVKSGPTKSWRNHGARENADHGADHGATAKFLSFLGADLTP